MKLFRYADGYVRIKVWGGSAERFMVLCSYKQMPLWDAQAQGKYIFMNMRLKDFYNCKSLARKAGIRAVVVERHGLPFFLPKIYKRSFWLVGLCLFVTGWLVTTNMLLHIHVQGNYSITEDVFQDFLAQQGVYIGMWKKDIPMEELEKKIRGEFPQVTWTSGRLDGTVLIIDIKENDKPIVKMEADTPEESGSSLYADADGVVTDILVRNGVPMVRKGSEVKKGDLLVDGRVPVHNQAGEIIYYQYYEADADIGIRTTLSLSYGLPRVYVRKEYTGRSRRGRYISIGNRVYRAHFGERDFRYKDVVLEPERELRLGEVCLGMGVYEVREYANTEREYTLEEAKALLEAEFEKNNTILMEKGVQILEKDVTIGIIMDSWALKGELEVVMPAFESRPIEIPEEIDDTEGV